MSFSTTTSVAGGGLRVISEDVCVRGGDEVSWCGSESAWWTQITGVRQKDTMLMGRVYARGFLVVDCKGGGRSIRQNLRR